MKMQPCSQKHVRGTQGLSFPPFTPFLVQFDAVVVRSRFEPCVERPLEKEDRGLGMSAE